MIKIISFQILVESQGGTWSESTSAARNHRPYGSNTNSSNSSSSSKRFESSNNHSNQGSQNQGSYDEASASGSYQNGASGSANQAKLDYFNKKMVENASRPE